MKASASLRFFIIFFSGVFFHHLYLLGSSPCFLYFFKRKLFFFAWTLSHYYFIFNFLGSLEALVFRVDEEAEKKKSEKKLLPKSNGLQERGVGEDSGHAKKEKKMVLWRKDYYMHIKK